MRFEFPQGGRDLLVVHADPAINTMAHGQLLEDVQKLVQEGLRKIVVDCSALDYMGTPGICALVQVHHWIKTRGGEMIVCGLHPMIADVFHITRLDRLFEVSANLGEALAVMGARG
jgi:anti-sigma B factor antagonist